MFIKSPISNNLSFPDDSVVKNPPANAGDAGLIPVLGRSPGGGHGNPLQYSYLGNPTDRGAWTLVHGVSEEWTRLSDRTTAIIAYIYYYYIHYIICSINGQNRNYSSFIVQGHNRNLCFCRQAHR